MRETGISLVFTLQNYRTHISNIYINLKDAYYDGIVYVT